MSMRCEDIGPLLAASAYEETDSAEAEAVEQHLEACAACRSRLSAFRHVRADLQQWRHEEAPSGTTFVGVVPGASARPGWGWMGLRGLAVAASLVLGLMLGAALINLEVSSTETGWTVRTSMFGSPADGTLPVAGAAPTGQTDSATPAQPDPTPPGSATPQLVSLEQLDRSELDAWLDQALTSRGLRLADQSDSRLTEPELHQVSTIVDDRLAQYRQQDRSYVGQLMTASEDRWREEWAATLAGVWENLEAQRNDQMLMVYSELGLLQATHGAQIDRTNDKIDFLINQVAAAAGDEQQRRQQERR